MLSKLLLLFVLLTSASAQVTYTHLTSGCSGNGQTGTSASITPSANKLILAWYSARDNALPDAATATGNSLTWVNAGNVTWDTVGTPLSRINLFRAMSGSPTTGTVVFDPYPVAASNADTHCWSIVEVDGVDTGGTNGSAAVVQVSSNARGDGGTTCSATLAAFGSASNGTMFGCAKDTTAVFTVGSGFSNLQNASNATPTHSIGTEFRNDNDTTPDMTMAAADWAGIAVEIKAAAGATMFRRSPIVYFAEEE